MGRLARSICLLAVLAAASPAAAGAATKDLRFDVKVGPKGDLPCTVDATLYTPDGVSKADPAPAILATNGFGGSKDDFAKLGASYAKRGYVFLAYSGLGFGKSTCKIALDDPDYDGKAGSQLVSFLGGSKAATDGTTIDYVVHDAKDHDGVARDDDPRVGMTGGSYGGEIQFAVAGVDPRVDTLQPQITWSDLSYSLGANNTDLTRGVTYDTPGVTKLDWPVLFFGIGVGDGLQEALQNGDSSHLAGVCPNFNDAVCPAIVQAGARGYADPDTLALLRHASVASYIAKIKIPVFLRQGEHDSLFNLQESVANYRALKAQGTPVKLLWRSSGHSGGSLGTQESDSGNPENAYETREELIWFDHYLRDQGPAPALDFQFLRDWALPKTGDAAPAVASAPAYPAATGRMLTLSGSDGLIDASAPAAPVSSTMASVPGSATGQGGAFTDAAPTLDPPGQSVSFSTGALGADTDLAGIPSVTVTLSAPTFAATQDADPAAKLVLFAKLYDDDGQGGAVLPSNLLSAARVRDVTKPVTIELPGIVHRFAKGHRLRLTLATANLTGRNSITPGPVTITGGTLTVPQLPAEQTAAVTTAPVAASGVTTVCGSARRFTITLPSARKGDHVTSASVTLSGKKVAVTKASSGKRTAVIDLRSKPKGTYTVLTTVTYAKHRTRHGARRYRTCTAGAKKAA